MNEKIKKLAEQATSYMPGQPPYDGLTFDMFDKEKFAELIVKECADIILNNDIEKLEDYGFNHPFFGGWERGVIDSAQIIKKHFGVEE